MRMKLKHYMEYVHSKEHARADDSPLYIFDGTFASRRGSRSMRKEYSVPSYFREDLMSLAGEKRRPPYRWLRCLSMLHLGLRSLSLFAPRAFYITTPGRGACTRLVLVRHHTL